jgi:hypothetical protein
MEIPQIKTAKSSTTHFQHKLCLVHAQTKIQTLCSRTSGKHPDACGDPQANGWLGAKKLAETGQAQIAWH